MYNRFAKIQIPIFRAFHTAHIFPYNKNGQNIFSWCLFYFVCVCLVIVVEGVEEDPETDPLVAGTPHWTLKSYIRDNRLFCKL